MVDIDHLYDRVKADSSLENLLDIIEIVVSSNSFKEDSFTISDLFVKISEQKECTDKMIETMYQYLVDNYVGRSHIWKMMNNGSKKLFDKLWGDDNKFGKWQNLWWSEHADSKQLEAFWNATVKDAKGIDKNWLQSLKNSFFRHPNAPKKILHRQLRNKESLLNLALNPSLDGKAFETVCDYARVYKHDGIFENLTRNKSIPWKKIADGVDLKMQVKSMMGGGIIPMTDRRKVAMMDFFLRPDCPDDVKLGVYKLIPDERLLPDHVKDMFLF